jgi:hypothetical protein
VSWRQQLNEISVILKIILLCLIYGKLESLGVKHESLLLFGEEKRE